MLTLCCAECHMLSHYSVMCIEGIFNPPLCWQLCTWRISSDVGAHPLPLFIQGNYSPCDSNAQLQLSVESMMSMMCPKPPNNTIKPSCLLAPIATNYCSSAAALYLSDVKGREGMGFVFPFQPCPWINLWTHTDYSPSNLAAVAGGFFCPD